MNNRTKAFAFVLITLISLTALSIDVYAITSEGREKPEFFDPTLSAQAKQCFLNKPCLEHARTYYAKPENVGKNAKTDDVYFAEPENVRASPESAKRYFSSKPNVLKVQKLNPRAADAYFGDPKNMKNLDEKNLEGADLYFSTKGNLEKFHEAGIEYLKKKYGAGLEFKMEKAIGVLYDSDKGTLTAAGNSLDLKSFKGANHNIDVVKGGEFKIDGNNYKGFAMISRKDAETFILDDVIVEPALDGNVFTPSQMVLKEGTNVRSVREISGYPAWTVTNNAGESLKLFLDETNVLKMSDAAVSVSKGGVLANKAAYASIESGPLKGLARSGSLMQSIPVNELDLKIMAADSEFLKSNGFHIGAATGLEIEDGQIERIDMTPLSQRALKGELRYVPGERMKGDDVRTLQTMLNNMDATDDDGNPLRIDGDFGKRTSQALKNFQNMMSMPNQNGILDTATLQALYDANDRTISGSANGFMKGIMYAPREIEQGIPNPNIRITGANREIMEIMGNVLSQAGEVKTRVSSGFGPRTAPQTRYGHGSSYHRGIDIPLAKGTLVSAAAPGRVVFAGERGTAGNAVIIDHGNGLYSQYFHLKEASIKVKAGQRVSIGQVIGGADNTGNSGGNHLHFQITNGGISRDYAVQPARFPSLLKSATAAAD